MKETNKLIRQINNGLYNIERLKKDKAILIKENEELKKEIKKFNYEHKEIDKIRKILKEIE